MKKQLTRWIVLMGLLLPAIATAQDSLTYSVPFFTRIQVAGSVFVNIQQGSQPSIRSDRPIPPGFVVHVADQTLVIRPVNSKGQPVTPVHFSISVPELRG